ncbi:hypothetical protein B7R54_01960 [Subtercola boreus]|uniref:triphosphoribosyl-dephospho-CoA synthase n=1 Tax=Subtercola boreus TaxID=120213 RepID=A0A3E0VDW8_9MICO|nr:triphosphoribosyl-dephospho-CoA synthase [Subtercola boreus]RFA08116.1 hypothetical protein B7R54_01960 [Subtercola boreus]TQL54996.1 triphosphoribosyl-dephospho-CoA synthase [Subtercola boreus]
MTTTLASTTPTATSIAAAAPRPGIEPATLEPAALARLAVDAIASEALLTPKPGLVDGNGRGSHDDMNLQMLLRSSEALLPTFEGLAGLGQQQLSRQQLRDRVGVLGRSGEGAMLQATDGVNTHRGALWAVGLLVTAAASSATEDETLARAAELAATADSAGPPPRSSHGQKALRAHGVSGAVGEAVAGFPHIVDVALPALRSSLGRGESVERARLRTLLALIATVDDTCVLHRGGAAGLRWMQRSARRAESAPDFDHALRAFSDEADRRRLSPGGSADLLAGAIFLDSLRFHLQENDHAHV